MSAYELRGLLTEDGEIDFSQHWQYGFYQGRFLAALFDDVVDGEWWAETWYPFHDPREPIEAFAADTVEELEEILAGGEIPAEVVTALRDEEREYRRRAATFEAEAVR